MDEQLSTRINAMARRDKITAVVFTVAMWIVLVFTYIAINSVVPTIEISVVLIIALVLLGGFNTASMIAMIRGYAQDKEFVYREDILNLDKMKQGKN